MRLGRKLLLTATAVALPLSLVAIVAAGPASAGGPKFSGPATGTVTCTGVTVKLTFSPPLKLNSGGSSISGNGKLSSCTVSGSTDSITQGKVTFTSTGVGMGCSGLAQGSLTPVVYNITWKGKHGNEKATFDKTAATVNGTAGATDGSGNAGFEIPNPSNYPTPGGGNVTGSFAGTVTGESFSYTSKNTTAILNACNGKHGLKKLVVTHGSLSVP
jgi:hypothetical protein